MDRLAIPDFQRKYPNARRFTSLAKARLHHQVHGGTLWHAEKAMMVAGYPSGKAPLFAVVPTGG